MSLKIITNNWQIKLVTLIVAVSMWVFAASSATNVAKFPSAIPIKTINLSPGMVALYDQKEAKIEIAAEPSVWKKLSVESFTAFIDLTGLSTGTHDVPVNIATNVSDVQIISKNPSSLVVTIEPSMEKEVPVVAKVSGNAAENMIAGDINFNPATVKISGPKSIVDGVSQATAEIILAGEAENFSKTVKPLALDNKNQAIETINFVPQSVVAEIKIVKAGNVKNLGIKVATSGAPAAGYWVSGISTNPATVSIVGAPEVVRGMTSISTQPIDLNGVSKTFSTQAKLDIPVGVKIDGNTSSVTVAVTISASVVGKQLSLPIKTKNLKTGLSISSITPQTVEVIISGAAEAVSGASADNISIYLDLSPANPGSNNLSITNGSFILPAGVSVNSFQPESVAVVLQPS